MIMRRKSRYVLVMSSKPFEMKSRLNEFIEALKMQLGSIGLAELDLSLIKEVDSNLFIFKLKRGEERKFILALSFIKLDSTSFYSIMTSGTINSLLKKYNAKLEKSKG